MQNKIYQGRLWERFCKSIYQKVDLYAEGRKARKSCLRQLDNIKGGYGGSNYEFRSQVIPFWGQYGIKPDKMWYDLYCYKDDKYDPKYIPEDIYWNKVYPALNKVNFRHAYTDKCFYDRLFPYLKQVPTLIKNSNSCFYDGAGNIISYSQAKSILESEKSFVIKPAIYSGEGVNIFFYDRENTNQMDIDDLMMLYNSDYIVQEIAKQHSVLANIHSQSLNTIRVISFIFEEKIHISSSILRMGVAGSRLDNVSVGGLACQIRPDGRLENKAMNKSSQWMTSHPDGAVFSEILIPSYNKVLEAVRRAHKDIPHFRLVGWDFSIDKKGEPVLIEYNGAPGLNQVSCGPLFGDLTEAVLNSIFVKTKQNLPHMQQLINNREGEM